MKLENHDSDFQKKKVIQDMFLFFNSRSLNIRTNLF